jgi:hypothetical protein
MTTKGRAAYLLHNAHERAKKAGLECTLTRDWIKAKLETGICEVTGLPFEFKVGGGKGHRDNAFSPSLDRINQKQGYYPENVRVTCWIYNRARGASSDGDFDRMISALLKKSLSFNPPEDYLKTLHPQNM